MDHERENIYFQLYNQRGGHFLVFQGARYIQYGNGFRDVLLGFLLLVLPLAVKRAASFLGSLIQKSEEGQNKENKQNKQQNKQQNEEFSLLLALF